MVDTGPSGWTVDPGPEEYDLSVRRLIGMLNDYGGGVDTVTPTVGRTTIDFTLGEDTSGSVMDRAAGGRFGSSIVVDTNNDEILTATLRYGSMELPEEVDNFLVTSQIADAVEETDPPLEVTTAGVKGMGPSSPGDGIPGITVRLRQMGGDILHVVVSERVDVGTFVEWFERLDPAVRAAKPEARQFALDFGGDA